jgi:flagellar biosynthetic protein FliS
MALGIMDTADVAAAYKRSTMISETPDIDWVLRGWRGLRTYVMRAGAATRRHDLSVKHACLDKASKLLILLEGITPDAGNARLSARLRDLYTSFQVRLVMANATNDAAAMNELAGQLTELDHMFSRLVPPERTQGVSV